MCGYIDIKIAALICKITNSMHHKNCILKKKTRTKLRLIPAQCTSGLR